MSFCPPLFDASPGQAGSSAPGAAGRGSLGGHSTATRRLRYHNKHHTIFITRLPPDADERTLAEVFSPFGFVVGVYVERNERGDSMNYAFVELDCEQAAASAVRDMDRQLIKGPEPQVAARCVTVDFVRGSRAANLLGERHQTAPGSAPSNEPSAATAAPPLRRSPEPGPSSLSPYGRAAEHNSQRVPAASPLPPAAVPARTNGLTQRHEPHGPPRSGYGGPPGPHDRYAPPYSGRDEYGPPRGGYGGHPGPHDRYAPPPSGHHEYGPPRGGYGGHPGPHDRYGPPPSGHHEYGPPPSGREDYGPPPSGHHEYGPPPSGREDYGPPPSGREDYGPPPGGREDYGPPPGGREDYGPAPAAAAGVEAYDPCSPGMDDEYRSHSPPYSPNTPPPAHAEAPQPPLPIPSALSMLASMLRSKDEAKDAAGAMKGSERSEGALGGSEASREPASPADDEGVAMPDQSPTAWRQHLGVLPKELVVIDECEGDDDGGQAV